MPPLKTSEYLKRELDSLAGDVARPAASDDHEPDQVALGAEDLMETVRSALLASHERLSTQSENELTEALRKYPAAREWLLDDHLCKSLIRQVPLMVGRISRLEPIVAQRVPDDAVNSFLQEAVRSYSFGLFQATVALAGAAMEHALRERVPYADVNSWLLDDLITAAGRFKILNTGSFQLAKQVQRARNHVLHGTPCESEAAFDTLASARGVLEALYSGDSQ